MIIKQISIFVENRPGRLAEITDIIAQNNINIRALSIADTTHFGILRIITEHTNQVEEVLKQNGLTVSITSVISVCINDKPGGLSSVLHVLADNDIQIEYMYAFVSNSKVDDAYVVMRIEDDLRAQEILKAHGFYGLEMEE